MKNNEKKKWYQTGEFEDGYQFGDVFRTIKNSIGEKKQEKYKEKAIVQNSGTSTQIPFAAVKDGKLSLDVPAQTFGWKDEAERVAFKAEHPMEYAVTGGVKLDTNILSRNYTLLSAEGEELLKKVREQDDYFREYGVLDFAKNYNIDAVGIQKEIDVLDEEIKSAKKSDRLSNNLVLDVETRKKEADELGDILNKYGCNSIDELEGICASKKQAKEFWKRSHDLAKMSEVGDETSDNYDPDFEKWVNIGKNLKSQNISGEQLAPHQALNPVETVRTMYADYIGNIEGLSQRIALNLADDSMNEIAAILQMTDKQVKLYNYYLGKEYYHEVKSGTANKYLEYLKTQYNSNTADIIQKELKNKPFFQYLYSAHAGKQGFEDNMKSLGDILKKDIYRAETTSQKANTQIRQDVIERDGIVGQLGYDLINTASYQLPSILASTVSNVIVPGSGPIVGAGLNGVSYMSGAYNEAKRTGFDDEQARLYAAGIGASEALLSYTIGGISKFGGKLSGNIISKTLDGIDNGIARFALQYGGRIVSEGLEEGIQEILNPIFKALASNTSVEYWGGIDWEDVAYSALLGGLSSGVFELSSSITTNLNNNKLNPNEVIEGIWEDSPNSSKNIVEKSQLESVENVGENEFAEGLLDDQTNSKKFKIKPDVIDDLETTLKNQLVFVDDNGQLTFIPTNVIITNTKVIAGADVKNAFRDAKKYVDKYGGNEGDYRKVAGKIESAKYIFDIHFVKDKAGNEYDFKIKSKTLKEGKK